jgi:MOSC domain-containing protein YiiM
MEQNQPLAVLPRSRQCLITPVARRLGGTTNFSHAMTFSTLCDDTRPGAKVNITDPDGWCQLGPLKVLHIRPQGSEAPIRVKQIRAIAHVGLEHDKHADPLSPRQLLIAGARVYQELDLPTAVLRENLQIDFPTEDLASGDLLRIGANVVLWLTFQCEPCKHLERRRPGVVKAVGNRRGMLARVVSGGIIKEGDLVQSARSTIPAMSNDWKDRVLTVMRAMPAGHVIEYRQLAELAGVAKAYCRAFPKVLSKLPPEVASRAQAGGLPKCAFKWTASELFDVRHHLAQADIPG